MKDFFSSFIFSGERDILVLVGTQSFTLLKTDLNQDINIDFAFSRCLKGLSINYFTHLGEGDLPIGDVTP